MPSSLEAEPAHQIRTRLFTPSDVFSVLYGKTRTTQDNKDLLNTQVSAQLRTAAGINTGKLCFKLIIILCLPKSSFTHAQLRGDHVERVILARFAQYLCIDKC